LPTTPHCSTELAARAERCIRVVKSQLLGL
jgi:hypothetical protein